MTKIKKSICAAVVGLVMCLAVVLGVVLNVNNITTSASATANEKAELTAIMQGYFPVPANVTTEILVENEQQNVQSQGLTFNYTPVQAYERVKELVAKLDDNDKLEALVGIACTGYETIKASVFDAPEAVIPMVNEDLQTIIDNSPKYYTVSFDYGYTASGTQLQHEDNMQVGIVYSDVEIGDTAFPAVSTFERVKTAFEALDNNQKQYVASKTEQLKNYYATNATLELINGYKSDFITKAREVEKGLNGVKYTLKPTYDTAMTAYNKFDPTAKQAQQVVDAYSFEGLDQVFDDILAKADAADTAIAALSYYSKTTTEMVTAGDSLENLEVVVDSQSSVDAITTAVNAIYNGRQVNGFTVATETYSALLEDSTELEALTNAGKLANHTRYDEAKTTLDGYKADAAEVESQIEGLTVTVTDHYKVKAVEDQINEVYDAYAALNVAGYNDHNNKQNYLDSSNKTKIEDYKSTVDSFNAWIKEVATLVNDSYASGKSVEEIDALIQATLADSENVPFNVNDYNTVKDLIRQHETLATDDIKTAALKDPRAVLDLIKDKIEERLANEAAIVTDIQQTLEDIGDVLNDGVKYADKATLDNVKELIDGLSDPSKEQVQEDPNYKNLQALEEALAEIEKRAQAVQEAIAAIQYRHNTDGAYSMSTDPTDGEIVVDSKTSIDAVTTAIEAVYDGSHHTATNDVEYNLADLDYPWTEDAVSGTNAFVKYDKLTQAEYDKYDKALADLKKLQQEAKNVENRITALTLSETNHYKAQETTINNLKTDYDALNRGQYNNLQDWVSNSQKLTDAKNVLDELNRWILTVAIAIQPGTDAQTADSVISQATAGEIPVKLKNSQIDLLLQNYDSTTGKDPIKEASVKEAHDLLIKRQEEIAQQVKDLKERIESLLDPDGVKYSVKDEYDQLKKDLAQLQEEDPETYQTVTEDPKFGDVETVGDALTEIENRAKELGTAIDDILYYMSSDGSMQKDSSGEIVYDSGDSIRNATDKLNAIYDGTDNIASLEYPWDAEEIAALTEHSDLTGITAEDLEKYDAALADYTALEKTAQDVMDAIDALTLTTEEHYLTKEADIVDLYNRYVALKHESETETYHNHNDWQQALSSIQKKKIEDAKTNLDAINAFILEVAQLVEETATDDNADAVIEEALQNGFDDQYSFDYDRVKELLDKYANQLTNNKAEEFYDAKVAALKNAKDLLDAMYERMRTLNNQVADTVNDLLDRDSRNELTEEDYDAIMDTKETYDKFSEKQKEVVATEEPEDGWHTIYPHTIDEFTDLADKFQFALYYKQAVDELVAELGNEYFTVEGYVLEKALLSMYFTFDPSMQAMVKSSYEHLLEIDEAYKTADRVDYDQVVEQLQDELAQKDQELTEQQEEFQQELQNQLEAQKGEIDQKQAELEQQLADKQAQLEQNNATQQAAMQSQTDEANDKVAKLKKALTITAIVGGIIAVVAVAAIVVLFLKTAKLAGGAAAAGSSKGGKEE